MGFRPQQQRPAGQADPVQAAPQQDTNSAWQASQQKNEESSGSGDDTNGGE